MIENNKLIKDIIFVYFSCVRWSKCVKRASFKSKKGVFYFLLIHNIEVQVQIFRFFVRNLLTFGAKR